MKEASPTDPLGHVADHAAALLRNGRVAEAESACRNSLIQDPGHVGLLNVLGQCLLAQRRFGEAAACFEAAIATSPLPNLHFNLGLARQGEGNTLAAVAAVQRAIELDPQVPQLHAKLGQLLLIMGQSDVAVLALERAVSLAPPSASLLVNLSEALLDAGRPEEAEQALEQALALSPRDWHVLHALGRLRQQQGRFGEAADAFRQAIDAQPGAVPAYFALAYSQRVTPSDVGLIGKMETLLRQPGLQELDRSHLDYALGKCQDDLGNYAKAIDHFDAANRRRLALAPPFDLAQYREGHRLVGAFCERTDAITPSTSERPLLIVGMVRSGTTLVEQILAAHPDVAAGGELPFWLNRVAAAMASPEGLASLREVAGEYLAELENVSVDARHVTDKMPTNYEVLGVVLSAFPRARIVHCRRQPVDTCLSIYVTPYRGAPAFAHDRETIVAAYREYQVMMEGWRTQFPEAQWVEVEYERLVAEPEPAIRALLDAIGLPWNEACLHPEQGDQMVRTPSHWQVRQPVNQGSVARWRRYEPWLGVFRELLPD